jgi:hypothetical protein
MAEVTIPHQALPGVPRSEVCVDCGAPADRTRPDVFTSNPGRGPLGRLFSLFPGGRAVRPARHQVTIELPVCPRHAARPGRWPAPACALLAGGLILCGVGAALPSEPNRAGTGMLIGGVGLVVIAGRTAMVLGGRRVRATEITDRAVRLAGVSDGFARALAGDPAGPAPSAGDPLVSGPGAADDAVNPKHVSGAPARSTSDPGHLAEARRPTRHIGLVVRRGTTGLGPDLAVALVDVAPDGLGVRLRAALPDGEDVEAELATPGVGKPLRLRGQVAGCRSAGDGTYLAGVRLRQRLTYREWADLTR